LSSLALPWIGEYRQGLEQVRSGKGSVADG
jgi:hypothetical protein